MTRYFAWLVVGSTLLVCFSGCSRNQPAQESQPGAADSVDHVVYTKPVPPVNFLHNTFTVKTYETFDFSVPAHIVRPVLHGSFESFAKSSKCDLLSNQSADIDLLLFNDQEFDDFTHSRQGSASYTVEPAHSQSVDYSVTSTVAQPQKYHLVFRNSPGGAHSKIVKADFTISFE